MALIQTHRPDISAQAPSLSGSGSGSGSAAGPARQCVIRDRRGRRMVMPRYTTAEAIEQIAGAIAGRHASAEAKRLAWEHLRDQQGFTIEWIEPKRARVR